MGIVAASVHRALLICCAMSRALYSHSRMAGNVFAWLGKMLSLPFQEGRKWGPGRLGSLVLALGSLAGQHRASHPTSLRLWFFVVKTGPAPVLPDVILQGWDIFDVLWLVRALQTRSGCPRCRNSLSHPGHLHRGYAAGRLRVVAPCWRTGLWGTRESLEDKRTQQGVSYQWVP